MSDQDTATTSSESEATITESSAIRGASTRLSEAREKMGFSQKEVADKLYLTTTFIRYIDDGEFERIPKPAFIKGYLRSYARVVELSGDEIVALYEAELEAAEPTPEIRGVTEEKVGTASITGPVLQTGLIGLVGLMLVMALIWWLSTDTDSESRKPVVTQPKLPGPEVRTEVNRQGPSPRPEPEAFGYMEASSTDTTAAVDTDTVVDDSQAVADAVDADPGASSVAADEVTETEPVVEALR